MQSQNISYLKYYTENFILQLGERIKMTILLKWPYFPRTFILSALLLIPHKYTHVV